MGDNMHRKHVVLRFRIEITSPHRGFVLDSEQKLRYSDNHFGLKSCFKIIAK